MFTRRGKGAACALALIVWCGAAATAWAGSGWSPTGDMANERRSAASVKLQDGRVLVVGGADDGSPVPGAERYDPATGTWSPVAPPLLRRVYATATRLHSGHVLLAGGRTAGGVTNHAEIYNPSTDTWTATGAMAVPRVGHTAVLLGNGKVLVAGGADWTGSALATGELFDPATGTWTAVPDAMSSGRGAPQTTMLADGRVLVAGGFTGSTALASADVYDPGTNAWTATGAMPVARGQGAAVLLPSGRALVSGGATGLGSVTSIVLYDPAAGTWATVPGAVAPPGSFAGAVVLESGSVLLRGDGSLSTPRFLPASGTTTGTHAMSVSRSMPVLERLDDGRVLIAGGLDLRSAEVYTPPTTRATTGGVFGEVEVGEAAERDVTVTNTGGERLRPAGVAVDGDHAADFTLVHDACAGRTLVSGQTCTVRVRFAPSAAGTRAAQLAFADNAEPSPAVTLTGTGVGVDAGPQPEPPQPPPPGPPAPAPAPQPAVPAGTPTTPRATPTTRCGSRRRIVVTLGLRRAERLRSGTATLNGKRLTRLRTGGRTLVVDLRKRPYGTYVVRVRAKTTGGRTIAFTRTYRTCRPRQG